MSNDVTREGREHIERWQRAVTKLADAKSAVNRAECELSNSTNALGKWLAPDDAKEGEKFCVWHGDSLMQAEDSAAEAIRRLRTLLADIKAWDVDQYMTLPHNLRARIQQEIGDAK